jgi:hypothetical protein
MIRVLQAPSRVIQDFPSYPLQYECTLKTPHKDLARFVSTVLAPFEFHQVSVSTYEIVFEPKSTLKLLSDSLLSLEDKWRFNLEAERRDDIAHLLEALLSDWIDFAFVLSPPAFSIFADHDEYITFYSIDERTIGQIAINLHTNGYQLIENYKRPLKHWGRERDRNI